MADNDTLRPPAWALLLAVVIGGGFYLGGVVLETEDRVPATIVVSGEGKVTAVPDIAELSFGVQTGRRSSAKVAMEKLRKDMQAIVEAVKNVGIEEKDIRTENFQLNPAYDWSDGRQVLQGYEANQSLRAKVRDLEKVNDVLEAATNAGANQAGSVSFTIDDPYALQTQAREKAIAKAKENAQKLAAQLGVRVVRLTSFSEGGGGTPPPVPFYGRAMMEAGMGGEGELPLPAGEQEITVQVTLTYEVR